MPPKKRGLADNRKQSYILERMKTRILETLSKLNVYIYV